MAKLAMPKGSLTIDEAAELASGYELPDGTMVPGVISTEGTGVGEYVGPTLAEYVASQLGFDAAASAVQIMCWWNSQGAEADEGSEEVDVIRDGARANVRAILGGILKGEGGQEQVFSLLIGPAARGQAPVGSGVSPDDDFYRGLRSLVKALQDKK